VLGREYLSAFAAASERCSKLMGACSASGEAFGYGLGGWGKEENYGGLSPNTIPWRARRAERRFNAKPGKEAFEMARLMAEENASVRKLYEIKLDFFARGFHLRGQAGEWQRDGEGKRWRYPWRRLVKSLFKEYLVSSNCVAYWFREEARKSPAGLPWLYVAHSEHVEYDDARQWEPRLKLKLRRSACAGGAGEVDPGSGLSVQVRRELARGQGGGLGLVDVTDMADEIGWVVGSSDKEGMGLGVPSIYSLLFDLAIADNLRVGDWNASHAARSINLALSQHQQRTCTTAGNHTGQASWN